MKHAKLTGKKELTLSVLLFEQCLSAEEDKRLAEIQKQIVEMTTKNRASFRLTDTVLVVRIYHN